VRRAKTGRRLVWVPMERLAIRFRGLGLRAAQRYCLLRAEKYDINSDAIGLRR